MPKKNKKYKAKSESEKDLYRYEDYKSYTQLPTEQMTLSIDIVSGKYQLTITHIDFGRGGTFAGDTTCYTLTAKLNGRRGQYLFLKVEENQSGFWRKEITLDRKNKTFVPWDARDSRTYPASSYQS
ncbi:MAG TPA: hypothetical protein PKC66_08570 [Leptospiraceae bacterium]|nr:hypothetical protein [Leptospiraceae bacterium]